MIEIDIKTILMAVSLIGGDLRNFGHTHYQARSKTGAARKACSCSR